MGKLFKYNIRKYMNIKTISEQLKELDGSLEIYNESKWGAGDEHTKKYSAFNDAGVECEVGEFLYSFMRLIKPNFVLETGTHQGVSSSFIASALKNNGFGVLHTHEFNQQTYEIANERFTRLNLNDYIVSSLTNVNILELNVEYDFIFLDTEPQTRFDELVRFYPNLKEGGYLFIHDLHRNMSQIPNEEHGFGSPYGLIPKEMNDLVLNKKLVPFHYETPRGLTMFYKPKSEDYSWQ